MPTISFCFWHYLAGLILADGHIKRNHKRVISVHISSSRSRLGHLLNVGFHVGEPFNIRFDAQNQAIQLTWGHKRSIELLKKRLMACNFAYALETEKLRDLTAPELKPLLKTFSHSDVVSLCMGFTEGDGEVELASRRQVRLKRVSHHLSTSIRWSQKKQHILKLMASHLSTVNADLKHYALYKTVTGHCLRFNHKTSRAILHFPMNWLNPHIIFGLKIMNLVALFDEAYNFSGLGLLAAKNHKSYVSWSFNRYALLTLLIMLRLRRDNPNNQRLKRLVDQLNRSLAYSVPLNLDDLLQCPQKFAKQLFHNKSSSKTQLNNFIKNLCAPNPVSKPVPLSTNENLQNQISIVLKLGFESPLPDCAILAGKQISFYPKYWCDHSVLPNRLKPLIAYNHLWDFTGSKDDVLIFEQHCDIKS